MNARRGGGGRGEDGEEEGERRMPSGVPYMDRRVGGKQASMSHVPPRAGSETLSATIQRADEAWM
jgi:hypothetical protein